MTAIHDAIMERDRLQVERLIALSPALKDEQDELGDTPLHCAFDGDAQEIVIYLLQNGADPNIANAKGYTPLHRAWTLNKYDEWLEVVQLLIEEGADVNAPLPNAAGTKRHTLLYWSLVNERTSDARLLLDNGGTADIDSPPTEKDMRPILQAMNKHNEGLAWLMLEAGAKPDGMALSFATNSNCDDLTIELLRLGADPNEHALHLAARRGYDDMIMLFLRCKANVNALSDGNTPLHAAAGTAPAEADTTKAVEVLLAAGADVHKTSAFGLSALDIAAERRSFDISKLLVAYGAKPTGDVLRLAAEADDLNIVQACVEAGVDINFHEYGCTALHYAAGNGNKKVADYLLSNGAKTNITDGNDDTPLHWAARGDFDEYWDEQNITDCAAIASALLSCDETDVDAQNKQGRTALHIALERRI